MSEKIIVSVDANLKKIIPGFLKNREGDIEKLKNALKEENFGIIQDIGHQLSGNSGCYGFITLGKLGQELEAAAKSKDLDNIKLTVGKIIDHLDHLEIQYD